MRFSSHWLFKFKILSEAASLLPQMTEHEHGQISRLASILLLGFFLPNSTGNEFFLLQNLSSRTHINSLQATGSSTAEQTSSPDALTDFLMSIPLDERLASTSHEYSDSFGELNTIVDERFDATLHSFLKNAVVPLLSTRPAHTRQVDHLHVLAMAIHPHPSEQPLRATVAELKKSNRGSTDVWGKTSWLMSSMVPHSFHLNYRHRRLLAQVVDAPLFEGALLHLRASLYAFGMASLTPYDSHWAQCGMVSIAVQAGQSVALREEWGRLLNRLMEDRTHYKSCQTKAKAIPSLSFMTETEDSFCPHRARGRLLNVFLSRLGQSRHFADDDFLQHTLSSLSDAIEFKVDSWTKEEDEQSHTSEPPCVLASLLLAAQPLFCFLLPLHRKEGEDAESDGGQYRDMLVSCGTQLLHHWDREIAQEASHLLEMAFTYGPVSIVDDYSGALFSSIKMAIENALKSMTDDKPFPITGIIAMVSAKCRSIAKALLKLLTSLERTEPSIANFIDRLIASVCCACPTAADAYMDKVQVLLDDNITSEKSKQQLLAALLGKRRSHFFNKSPDPSSKQVQKQLATGKIGWDMYLLGRQALVSGSYSAAAAIYEELSFVATSDYNYLWLSSLQKIGRAEGRLLEEGALGIPATSIDLLSAASTFQSLPAFLGSIPADFEFQLRFVNLRLDFLDLVCSIRQLASEMRLTGVGPNKFTRSGLHLKSAVKLLNGLGTKYLSAYREHGLFMCQQSRTSLRTLHALCRFVASATQSTFIDELPDFGKENIHQNALLALTLPQGDASHPLTILMKRLDSQVLKDLSGSVDAKIRAAALLQVLDGVLKVPSPFPRAFLRTKQIHRADYRLYLDPEVSDDHGETEDDVEDVIDLPAGSMVTAIASGNIPEEMMQATDLRFFTVIIWHRVSFQKIHTEKNRDTDQDKPEDDVKPLVSETKATPSSMIISTPAVSKASPTNVASLSPAGKFFVKLECERLFWEPGKYRIETRLGCRDLRGGEWELPVDYGSHQSLSIRIHKA